MTVSSIIPVNNYTGNNNSRRFDFDFLIENRNELVVTHISESGTRTTLLEGIDYDINETGNKNGSYIIFPLEKSNFSVLNENEKISLTLNLEIKQESEFENSSYLNLKVLEWTFDYLVRLIQMISQKLNRAVKVPEGSNIDTDELSLNLNTVANNVSDINSIAKNISDISDIADKISNINIIADNILNINAVSYDLENINNASRYATNASISAENAASSEINARIFKNDAMTSANSAANSASIAIEKCEAINILAQETLSNSNDAKTAANSAANSESVAIQKAILCKQNADSSALSEQNALRYSILAQTAVDSNISIELLSNSKALRTGDVSNYSSVYSDIYNYAHSNFNNAPFIVEGSPVISSDGIAEGFSINDYLYSNINISSADNFEIRSAFTIGANSQETQVLFQLRGAESTYLDVVYFPNTNSLRVRLVIDGYNINKSFSVQSASSYYLKINFSDGVFSAGISSDNFNWSDLIIGNNSTDYQFTRLLIGQINNELYWTGSIDLKQFSIKINGFSLLSGNKTGFNTIQSDNFSISGTPSIDNGIISNFSATNYLTFDSSPIDWSLPYKINFSFTTGNTINSNTCLTCLGMPMIRINSNAGNTDWALQFFPSGILGDSDQSIGGVEQNVESSYITKNTTYYIEAAFDGSTYSFSVSPDGITYTLIGTLNGKFQVNSSLAYIGKQYDSDLRYLNGSINLNEFNIFQLDTPVYNPLNLYIPYNLSITGSKIVDARYRDIVQQLYSKDGMALYYTLDEVNQNFTLPMGEIYGMIEKNKNELADYIPALMRIGEPIATLSSNINNYEIWLEGAEVSRITYKKLFEIYGTTYGEGNGTTTFNLPDFRGRVVQGKNNSDSFGYIEAGLPDISGTFGQITSGRNNYPTASGAISVSEQYEGSQNGGSGRMYMADFVFNASASNLIYGNSTTVQPPAVKVRFKTRWTTDINISSPAYEDTIEPEETP